MSVTASQSVYSMSVLPQAIISCCRTAHALDTSTSTPFRNVSNLPNYKNAPTRPNGRRGGEAVDALQSIALLPSFFGLVEVVINIT